MLRSFLVILTVIFTMAAGPALAEAPGKGYADSLKAKKLVLAIGIDRFQDPIWRQLRYARKDATSVYGHFMGKESGFDGGELLASDKGTTSVEIYAALERLQTENRNDDDTVVVYLSMHGSVAYKPDGRIGRYIITSDTDSQKVAATSVDYERLMESFRQLRSRKKVLILAFCHSGVGKSALTPDMKRALAQLKGPYFEEPIQERSEGSIVLTASGWQEPALEDDTLAGDVYTHFLLEGFNEDANGDGVVSVTEAHQHAANRTYTYTKGRQRPSAIVELLGADPIILRGAAKSKSATLYSLLRRYSPLNVFVDGQPKGSLEKGVSVPEGRVRVRIEDPKTSEVLGERVVHFRAGKEYSVADLLTPRLANTLVVGAATHGIQGRDVRTQYAPRDLAGVRVRYSRDEGLGIFDLGTDLSYFAPSLESIELERGIKVSQTRRQAVASVTAGIREKVGILSTTRPGATTELRSALGPAVLLVDRRVDEPSFEDEAARTWAPGATLTGGIDATFPYYLLKVSLDVQLGAYRRFADAPQAVVGTQQLGLAVGTFW